MVIKGRGSWNPGKGKKHMFKPEKLILPNNVENGCEPVNLQEMFFHRFFMFLQRFFNRNAMKNIPFGFKIIIGY